MRETNALIVAGIVVMIFLGLMIESKLGRILGELQNANNTLEAIAENTEK
jgi:hypothetical protein